MSKGLAQALLISTLEAFKGAAPSQKLRAPGYLQYLLGNNKPDIVSQSKDDGSGYIRDVKIRYRTRGVAGQSTTVDDCSIQGKPVFKEYTVPATSFRALGLAFEDDMIAQFERDALATTNLGTPSSQIMKDILDAVVEKATGLFADINNDCLAIQSANFGKNASTGSNAAKTINFPLSNATNDLSTGMTEVMSDMLKNEMKQDGACIVGSGVVANYYMQQPAKAADQSGVDTSQLILPKFYFDPYAQAGIGANKFALLEKDAVQFVNTCRFRGAKAGQRGNSFYATLRLPMVDSIGQAGMIGFEFDMQITFRECPGELQIGVPSEGNPPVQMGRGWNVILSSSYLPVFIPNDAYEATDPMVNVNGTLLYTATNV